MISQARKAIVLAFLICYTIAFIVALLAQIQGVLENLLGWGTVVLNLSVGVGLWLFSICKAWCCLITAQFKE